MQQCKQKNYDVSHVFHKGICKKKIAITYLTSTSMMKTHAIHSEECVKFVVVAEIGHLHT